MGLSELNKEDSFFFFLSVDLQCCGNFFRKAK